MRPLPHLHDFQKKNVRRTMTHKAICLNDGMGLGKRHPIDTKVLTPYGWDRIGTLAVGDQVIGSDGRPTTVVGVYPQGVQDSYRVHFSDHSSVEAGDEHLWTVRYLKGGRRWADLTLTTQQLMDRPTIEHAHTGRSKASTRLDLNKTTLYLPMLRGPVEFHPADPPLLPAYLVGLLIANGYLTGGSASLTVNTQDADEVASRLPMHSRNTYDGATRFSLPGLIGAVRSMGLDAPSRGKRIPHQCLRATPADRVALLQGLMDGDGSVSKTGSRLTYHTTSHLLALDVQELVEGLGGIASVSAYEREGKPTEYPVRLRLPEWVLPFTVSRKALRYQPGRLARPCRTVGKIEFVRKAESVCIAVDAPDRLYVTEHCILTHNTYCGLAHIQGLRDLDRIDTAVVVTKKSVVNTSWKARLKDAFPHLTYRLITGDMPKAKREKMWDERPLPDLFVCNFEIMINPFDGLKLLEIFRNNRVALIGDEVQHLKNTQTQRHQAWLSLAEKAMTITPMTGTPVETGPLDLYGMLSLMRYPRLPRERNWIMEWCNWTTFKVPAPGTRRGYHEIIYPTDFKKSKMGELREMLQEWFIRNPPELITLPPIREMTREIELTPHERKLYTAAEGKLGLAKSMAQSGNDYLIAQALKEALSDHSELRAICSGKRAQGLSAKDAELIDLLPEMTANDQKVVVYSPFKESLYRLIKHEEVAACNPVTIVGDDSGKRREENVNRFISDPTCKVLFMSDAGAEGVDGLQQKASRIVFFDRIYNPAREDQIFKRVHRQGQKSEVLKIKFVTRGTIEETVDDKLLQRRDVMDVVDHLTRTELTDLARSLLQAAPRR